MAANYTYPGVYVREIPSGVRSIAGVSTSDTAFVDFFARGPIDKAVRITGFLDFERQFGGLDSRSAASYAIFQFFQNGGSVAWVVRVTTPSAKAASRVLVSSQPDAYYGYGYSHNQFVEVLEISAASPGKWGEKLQVAVDHNVPPDPQSGKPDTFNLVVREVAEVNGRLQILRSETYRNLSQAKLNSRYADEVINSQSELIRLTSKTAGELPEKNGDDVIGKPEKAKFLWLGQDGYWTNQKVINPADSAWQGRARSTPASDGFEPGANDNKWKNAEGSLALQGLPSNGMPPLNEGMKLLGKIAPNIFNILCLPCVAGLVQTSRQAVWAAAANLCEDKRAFLIIDIPEEISTPAAMLSYMSSNDLPSTNYAAIYFPRILMPDPVNENRLKEIPPSGALAGVYARTDSTRGIWKAPAGIDATLQGVGLKEVLNDLENGGLNPFGANVLRNFPIYRNVVWGARTLQGSDQQASEWKYIPVRRTALFIEESLYQGLKWVVFEPNDEPLWASIRLNVGAFMNTLFRQGAFQGSSPRDAYFVKCDKETTTQADINLGIVNILVGFAPLKPAEFVVITIQQMAGQIQV
jgi:phage tail sheath protein FI